MISKNTRVYKAGNKIGNDLAETANLLYLLDNRLEYLSGIADAINIEVVNAQIALKTKADMKRKGIV